MARRPGARPREPARRRRSRGSPAAVSTAPRGCSTTPPAPSAPHCSPSRAARTSTSVPSERRGGRRPRGGRRAGGRGARAGAAGRSTASSFRRARRSSASSGQASAPSRTRSSPRSTISPTWYRDLVLVGAGAETAVVNADRLDDLRCGRRAAARPRTRRTPRRSCVRRGGRRRSSTSTRPCSSRRCSSACGARSAPYRQPHGEAEPLDVASRCSRSTPGTERGRRAAARASPPLALREESAPACRVVARDLDVPTTAGRERLRRAGRCGSARAARIRPRPPREERSVPCRTITTGRRSGRVGT